MTWQMVVWNMFVWTITGILIYVTKSSLFWLAIPAMFTMWINGSEAIKEQEKQIEKFNQQLEELHKLVKK